MLFRSASGQLIEIKKENFNNLSFYYEKILNIKFNYIFPENNQIKQLSELLKTQ